MCYKHEDHRLVPRSHVDKSWVWWHTLVISVAEAAKIGFMETVGLPKIQKSKMARITVVDEKKKKVKGRSCCHQTDLKKNRPDPAMMKEPTILLSRYT